MNLVPVKTSPAPSKFDLAIIGAGPAGMAAAITARECELSVLVVHENAAPGGQVSALLNWPVPILPWRVTWRRGLI